MTFLNAPSNKSMNAPNDIAQLVRKSVWIDTDPSVAPGGKEVDDGFALIQAFHSPELDIRGVSVVYGNAPLETAFPIGCEIVERFGPPGLRVHRGADHAKQLGEETDAVRALANALRADKLTILALGPVTTIATLIKNHPDLAVRIEEVVAVAGRRRGQSFQARPEQPIPFPDFNFELDPDGFQILLDSSVPITLAPWEVSSHVWLREADLDHLREGNNATRWLYPAATDWLKKWRDELKLDGFNPFDTLAVGWLTSPHLIEWETLPVAIETHPTDRPGEAAPEKPYLIADAHLAGRRTVRYCHRPSPTFRDDLMRRLLSPNNAPHP
jgi:inosine-uridine nucleoside N-ribohydrolase